MNQREKIISESIATCLRFGDCLDTWEKNFIDSVNGQDYPLTNRQFNKLHEITQRVNSKINQGGHHG